MKKIFNYVLILLVMVLPFVSVSAKKTTTTTTTEAASEGSTTVNLYVFYGDGCPHCEDLHTYLAELEKDEDYNYMFEVVDYEVWNDEDNATLMNNVSQKLKGEDASGVPLYVVGDYYAEGFPDIDATDADTKAVVKETETALKDAIKKAYKAANASKPTYEDIVAEVGSGNATVSEKKNSTSDSKSNDVIGYIILGVTVIIIIAIIFGRSSSKDEEIAEETEDETEEVEEEENEEPKKAEKKSTKKSSSSAKKNTSTKSTSAKNSSTKKSTSTKKTTKKNK